MKFAPIVPLIIFTFFCKNAISLTADAKSVTQSLDPNDSMIVFQKMYRMKTSRESTPSGREFEHRVFATADNSVILHCVALVSSSGTAYLGHNCQISLRTDHAKPEITVISSIAAGQGIMVEIKSSIDNETLFNQFLEKEASYYSLENIEIKLGNEKQTVPTFAVRCKNSSALNCRINLFHLDN